MIKIKKLCSLTILRIILLLFLTPSFFACNSFSESKTLEVLGSQKEIMKPEEFRTDCLKPVNKSDIYNIAKSILDKKENEEIWNLHELDTTEFFVTDDYFTNPKIKTRLVLIGGIAGLSAGTEDNMLLLFSCTDSLQVIFAAQWGDFTQSDIKDINGDGIKEIIYQSSMMWMGECNDSYSIFNFLDGKQNVLFFASSFSILGCGLENLSERYKKGDTLETKSDCSLTEVNNKYIVKNIQTIKVHNGGKTDEEIERKLFEIRDTIIMKF